MAGSTMTYIPGKPVITVSSGVNGRLHPAVALPWLDDPDFHQGINEV